MFSFGTGNFAPYILLLVMGAALYWQHTQLVTKEQEINKAAEQVKQAAGQVKFLEEAMAEYTRINEERAAQFQTKLDVLQGAKDGEVIRLSI